MVSLTVRRFPGLLKVGGAWNLCLKSLSTGIGSEVDFQRSASSALAAIYQDDFRQRFAPWLPIGVYEKELMRHLSTTELLRAALVLHLCRFDAFVKSSQELFTLSQRLKVSWLLRHTFFEQFVGGETLEKMDRSVASMHRRGVLLMLLPVVESDVSETLSESQCDNNLAILQDLMRLTAKLEPTNPTFHLKASAIISTSTLKAVSRVIRANGTGQAAVIEMFSDSIENGKMLENFPGLTPVDAENFLIGLRRADNLAKIARDLSVLILVDAEFVSCKEAISLVAHCLMLRYNGSVPLIGNTTQAYLKGALATATGEWNLIQNVFGVHWAGKVVRGAYMLRENEIARKLGHQSPVWSSYEETNRSYNETVTYLLGRLASGNGAGCKRSHLIVATHNERSIRLAAHLLKEWNLSSQSAHLVSFAQIYGMADYLSTPLVRHGFPVYKSTPFGPLESVLPYLSRRAIENRSVVQGARIELEMLKKEIKSRMRSAKGN